MTYKSRTQAPSAKARRMSSELSVWVRGQRQARGWSRAEMARRLIAASREAGDDQASSPENLCHSIYRWERGFSGISGSHRLLICRAFGISPARFGEHGADGPGEPDGLLESARGPSNPAVSRLSAVSFQGAPLPPVYEQWPTASEPLPRSVDRMSDFGVLPRPGRGPRPATGLETLGLIPTGHCPGGLEAGHQFT
jgi:transcriptional regulator with XRE-family HTH domain